MHNVFPRHVRRHVSLYAHREPTPEPPPPGVPPDLPPIEEPPPPPVEPPVVGAWPRLLLCARNPQTWRRPRPSERAGQLRCDIGGAAVVARQLWRTHSL